MRLAAGAVLQRSRGLRAIRMRKGLPRSQSLQAIATGWQAQSMQACSNCGPLRQSQTGTS